LQLHGRFLSVFTGIPKTSRHEQERSCFFVRGHLPKSAAKVLQNMDISKYQTQKDQKGLCTNEEKAVILQAK
jgi:hypothetical protein